MNTYTDKEIKLIKAKAIQDYLLEHGANDEKVNTIVRNLREEKYLCIPVIDYPSVEQMNDRLYKNIEAEKIEDGSVAFKNYVDGFTNCYNWIENKIIKLL